MTAHWITPSGKIIDVATTHIDYIIRHPDAFGLTTDFINEVHEQHGEPLGTEGKARDEIMTNMIGDGWIRTRYVRDGWHVQVARLNRHTKDVLFDWAASLTGEEGSRFTPVALMPLQGIQDVTTVGDILKGMLHQAKKKYRYPKTHK